MAADDLPVITLTMSKSAAKKLANVLLDCAVKTGSNDRDWLLWNVGLIAQAFPADVDGPDEF